MDYLMKIGAFVGIGLILNHIVYWMYRFAARKSDSFHLCLKNIINVFINLITIFSLASSSRLQKT